MPRVLVIHHRDIKYHKKRNVLLVTPTGKEKGAVDPLRYAAAHHVWLRKGDVVLVQDYHTLSAEYECLFSLLSCLPSRGIRVVLFSSTPHLERLRRSFAPQEIQISSSSKEKDPERFSRIISYFPDRTFYSMFSLLEPRTIIFCPTQKVCDTLAHRTLFSLPNTRVFSLHRGTLHQEFTLLRQVPLTENLMVFCTDFLEDEKFSIPNIDLVIDYCTSSSHPGYADQTALTKRAQKVGHDCPGRVYRLIDESTYDALPILFEDRASYEWDKTLLCLLSFGFDPNLLCPEAAVSKRIQSLIDTGALSSPGPRVTSVGFLSIMSEMRPTTSARLIELTSKTPRSPPGALLIQIVGLLAVDTALHLRCSLPFIPHSAQVDYYSQHFYPFAGVDELHTYLNIYLTSLGHSNLKGFATRFSMNHKVLLHFHHLLRSVLSAFFHQQTETWVLSHFSFTRGNDRIVLLTDQQVDHARLELTDYNNLSQAWHTPVYFGQPYLPFTALESDHDLHASSTMLKYQDHSHVDIFFPLHPAKSGNKLFMTLWTQPVTSFREFQRHLVRNGRIQRNVNLFTAEQMFRSRWKRTFDDTINEIRQEVAYRPGFVGALNVGHHFSHLAISMSECKD